MYLSPTGGDEASHQGPRAKLPEYHPRCAQERAPEALLLNHHQLHGRTHDPAEGPTDEATSDELSRLQRAWGASRTQGLDHARERKLQPSECRHVQDAGAEATVQHAGVGTERETLLHCILAVQRWLHQGHLDGACTHPEGHILYRLKLPLPTHCCNMIS